MDAVIPRERSEREDDSRRANRWMTAVKAKRGMTVCPENTMHANHHSTRALHCAAGGTSVVRRALSASRLTRTVAALAFVLALGACVHGDYITGDRWEDDRLTGTWTRIDLVNDSWYGLAELQVTWQFRSNGRVNYSEVLLDNGGRWLEETRAYGRWYTERRGDRVTIQYTDPSSWGTEYLRYDAYGHTLYLDGLRYDRR
ncbi:MAG TPA: hypothetical protein VKZ41_12260 [Gemmatimonadales bacterium]|nr:hypothetical protein [Gemmatimonadales bacterium]